MTSQFEHGVPLDPGRKGGTAAPAQAGVGDLPDHLGRGQGKGADEAGEAAVGAVVVDRQRVGDSDAGEGETFLVGEVGDRRDRAERERVCAAGEEIGGEEPRHVLLLHRAVGEASRRGVDLHHGFEPEHAAGAIAHQGDRLAAAGGFGGDRLRHALGAERARARVERDEIRLLMPSPLPRAIRR